MSIEGIKVPVGETSHLADEVPKPSVERTIVPTPLEIAEEDGSSTTVIDKATGQPTSIPAEIVDVKSGKEQLEVAKSIAEPCVSCAHFTWPKKGSDDEAEREAQIMGGKRRLPAAMGHIWPYGGPPEEFGICSEPEILVEDAEGRAAVAKMEGKALTHYHRAGCPNFRKRNGE
jgi:hypothetical protein